MAGLTPRRAGVAALLLGLGWAACVCLGHGESSVPPKTPPPPIEFGTERLYPCRWSWLHWWEANRDPYLLSISQSRGDQKPDQKVLADYRGKAVAALEKGARSAQPGVRAASALALGRMGEDGARATLERMATGDASVPVRVLALVSLGLLDSPEARAFLLGQRFPTDEEVEAAFAALGLLDGADDAQVLLGLQKALGDARPGLATVSAWGLRRRRDPANAKFLMAVLVRSKSPWLASEAVLSLGRESDAPSGRLLVHIVLASDRGRALAAWEALEKRDRTLR